MPRPGWLRKVSAQFPAPTDWPPEPQPHSCPSHPPALQKKPEEINRRSADMWSFAVLLWELVTREVPFADLSNMEIGMKVRGWRGKGTDLGHS